MAAVRRAMPRRAAWGWAMLAAVAVQAAGSVQAQTPRSSAYMSTSVSTSAFRSINSPLAPQSAEECNALDRELAVQTQTLSAAHHECISGTHSEPPGADGCAKASCQELHTANREASRWRDKEMSACRSRLNAILIARRRDEEMREKRRQAEAAEERKRELERARAEDKAKAEAATQAGREKLQQQARAREEADARERKAQQDIDRRMAAAEQAKSQHEQRMKDIWGQIEGSRERSALRTSLMQQEAQRLRGEREALAATAAAEQAKRDAAAAAETAARRSAAAKKDLEEYGRRMWWLGLGVDVAAAAMTERPFWSLGTLAATKGDEYLLNAGLDKALPLGPEGVDRIYERAVLSANALSKPNLPTANPFSSAFSGLSMAGITHLQREAIGQLDGAMDQVDSLLLEQSFTSATTSGGSSGIRPAKLPSPSSDNPFAAPPASPPDGTEPQATVPKAGADEVMVRQAGNGTVMFIPRSAWSDGIGGDIPELGERGCTVAGIGRITPACERWRRQRAVNPFR